VWVWAFFNNKQKIKLKLYRKHLIQCDVLLSFSLICYKTTSTKKKLFFKYRHQHDDDHCLLIRLSNNRPDKRASRLSLVYRHQCKNSLIEIIELRKKLELQPCKYRVLFSFLKEKRATILSLLECRRKERWYMLREREKKKKKPHQLSCCEPERTWAMFLFIYFLFHLLVSTNLEIPI
jgi:hypothetical protein